MFFIDNMEVKKASVLSNISLSTDNYEFMDIAIGGFTTYMVEVTNLSATVPLKITDVTSSGTAFTSSFADETILPNETKNIEIFFTPTAATSYTEKITINVEGEFEGNNKIDFTGRV